MWDGENKRTLIVMHGKENHNHTTGWCSLEYVLYSREGKTYINCLVKQSNNWNIETKDKIDSSLC
jgi:hypothetical protein